MKILYAGLNPCHPRGGGELSARRLLTLLARRHEVSVLGLGVSYEGVLPRIDLDVIDARIPHGFPWWPGPRQGEHRLARRLAARLKSERPDLVVLQQPATLKASDLPSGVRLVVLVHSALCYGLWDPTPQLWRRVLSGPSFWLRRAWSLATLRRADLIVANSDYVAAQLVGRYGLESVVVPPFQHVKPALAKGGDHILFTGLDTWKGGALALAIAAKLPARKLLFLEGSRPNPDMVAQAQQLPNVEVLPWTDDMARVHARCRLVLVPSLWEEPFGLVAIEACASGLPVVARAVGGLPEAVGPGGRLLPPDATANDWCAAIAGFDDADTYQTMAAKARAHAAQFDAAYSFATLRDTVQRHLGLDLGPCDAAP